MENLIKPENPNHHRHNDVNKYSLDVANVGDMIAMMMLIVLNILLFLYTI